MQIDFIWGELMWLLMPLIRQTYCPEVVGIARVRFERQRVAIARERKIHHFLISK